MPDACRWAPPHPREAALDAVAVWGKDAGAARHQVVRGRVLGKATAITTFHRLQRLVNAVGMRWLSLVAPFYPSKTRPSKTCSTRIC